MVARHIANAELVCWRCAVKSPQRYKPGIQQPTSGQPGKHAALRAWHNPVSTGKGRTQLDSSLRPVKKNSANSMRLSRSSQHVTLGRCLVRGRENASSSNPMPDIVMRRGSRWAPGRHGRYYTTSVSRKTLSSVKAIEPVDDKFTHNNPLSAGQNVREHLLSWWQQQLKPQVDLSGPFRANDINHPGATYNNLQQGPRDIQKIDGNEEDEDISSHVGMNSYIQPGDLAALSMGDELVLAVLVRNFFVQEQFYTMTGRWVHVAFTGVKLVIKEIIPPKDLEAIIPHLPQQEIPVEDLYIFHSVDTVVPREAGAKIIQRMHHFHNSTTQLIREYAGRLNHIHDIIAHPTKRLQMGVDEIAMKVFREESREALTSSMLWAVHAAINQNDCCRLQPPVRRIRQMVDIMSKADKISLNNVVDWVRDYQEQLVNHSIGSQETARTRHPRNPIPSFIKKARALIHESRKTRDATHSGSNGPSRVRIEPFEPGDAVWKSSPLICFDEDEMKVIRFFHAWSITQSIRPHSWAFRSTGSTILRALGMYEDYTLDRITGFLLLKELGIIPPWLDDTHYQRDLYFPGHHVDPLTDELHAQAMDSVAGFQMKDSMRDVRRDWGDLAVFCIDDAHAHEIDDGVSLEQIDERTFWVHVHVANPSAFLAPGSALARNAAHRTTSSYLSTETFPMLPPEITQRNFSLANNRPCITFSAKITLAGDITDTQISHGILRNVRHFTSDEVKRQLGGGRESEPEVQPGSLTVGGRMPTMPPTRKLTPMTSSDKRSLRRLDELAQAYNQRLARNGGLSQRNVFSEPVTKVYLGSKGMGQTKSHLHERTARRFDGDPIISLRVGSRSSTELITWAPGTDTITCLMLLAGEIGAMWCSSRNVPVPFRGILRAESRDDCESPKQFKQKYVDPLIAKQEVVPPYIVSYYKKLLGTVVHSPVPLRHDLLGLAAYTRATSPLRRFTDLLTHWQIEAAIRHESRTGKSLVGSTDESYLVYSRPEMESLLESVDAREGTVRGASLRSNRIWAHQFMFRAYYFNEAPLPELFNVAVYSKTERGQYKCWSPELGMKFETLGPSDLEVEIQIGDVWEAKINEINVCQLLCQVDMLRLVERPDGTREGPWTVPL
ncbi:hypothetical protein MMC07_005762 [Pseudocyphellaria aurata]|nr:hypothetical protein [Pseudocyphellaria aurata]